MKVPTEILNNWKGIRSRGDNKKIAEEKGITAVNVSRAFEGRECSDETFIAIRDFYIAKEARLFPAMGAPLTTEKPTSHE
jgi:hypothetical protein